MLAKILPTIYLLVAVAFAFIWAGNPQLSKFSLQLTALLAIIFAFHNWLSKRQLSKNPTDKSIITNRNISNAIIITLVVTLLVLETKGAVSVLFFLLDFLLIGLSLFFEPLVSLVLSLALIVGFMLNQPLQSTQALTNLISLLFMAPLAAFFSSQYLTLLAAKNEIKVLKHQAKSLKRSITAEEEPTLMWLTLNFHQTMMLTLDWFSQMGSEVAKLPYHQQQQFSRLYQDLKALFASGEQLKDKIDRLTDDETNS